MLVMTSDTESTYKLIAHPEDYMTIFLLFKLIYVTEDECVNFFKDIIHSIIN